MFLGQCIFSPGWINQSLLISRGDSGFKYRPVMIKMSKFHGKFFFSYDEIDMRKSKRS